MIYENPSNRSYVTLPGDKQSLQRVLNFT